MDHVIGREVHAHDFVDRHVNIVVELHIIFSAQLAVGSGIRNVPVKWFGG